MTAEALAAELDPVEWSKKDFTERVRIDPGLRGRGNRIPAVRVPVPRGQAVAVRPRLGVLLSLHTVCVEAQPILGSTLHWRIVDAKRGMLGEGYAELSDLAKRKPWDYGEI